jgi:hypothetical protein
MSKTLEQNTVDETTTNTKTIEEMIEGSPEEMKAAIELLENAENGVVIEDIQVEPEENKQDDDAQTQQQADLEKPEEQEPRVEIINYQGKEVKLEDPDGFLGRKNLEGMKKSFAHLNIHSKTLESENRELRLKATNLAKEREEYKKKVNEFETKKAEAVVELPSVTTEEQAPVKDDLNVPTRPKVSVDSLDWSEEDHTAMQNYYKELDEYNIKLKEAVFNHKPETQPTIKDETLQELMLKVAKFEEVANELSQQKQSLLQKQNENEYWNNIESFRKDHAEFSKYKGGIKDLHEKTQSWMNTLAISAGQKLPPNPTQADIDYFEATKYELANKYLNGDKSLVNTGVVPPQNVEEYFKLSDIENQRIELINQGLLGEKSTLHNAYVIINEQSGILDKGVETIEVNARKEGANAVLDMARGHQLNDATTLPDSIGATPQQSEQFNAELLNRALSADIVELQQNPDLMAAYKQYVEASA